MSPSDGKFQSHCSRDQFHHLPLLTWELSHRQSWLLPMGSQMFVDQLNAFYCRCSCLHVYPECQFPPLLVEAFHLGGGKKLTLRPFKGRCIPSIHRSNTQLAPQLPFAACSIRLFCAGLHRFVISYIKKSKTNCRRFTVVCVAKTSHVLH